MKIKPLLKFILSNVRYLVVLFLLVLVIIYSGNFNPTPDQIELATKRIQLERQERGEFFLSPAGQILEMPKVLNCQGASFCRLILKIKALNPTLPSAENAEKDNVESNLKLSAQSEFGETKELESFKIPVSANYIQKEIIFNSDKNYTNLILNRINGYDLSVVEVMDINTQAINCSNSECAQSLGKTETGWEIKNLSNLSQDSRIAKLFNFNRKNQTLSQVFYVENPAKLASVTLALEKIGSGGTGKYHISLNKVNKNGDNYLIGGSLANSYFDVLDLPKYQTYKDKYQFELASKLEKNSYYAICISNEGVAFNRINTLSLKGVTEQNQIYPLIVLPDSRVAGYLYFNLQLFQNVQSNAVLINAVVEDIGGGRGLYLFKFSDSPADLLDANTVSDSPDSQIFYDTVSRGVSGLAQSDSAIIYKFDTGHPIDKYSIYLKQPGNEFVSNRVFYSYDQSNWSEIQPAFNIFTLSIDAKQKFTTVYVKITYDQTESAKAIKLFNFSKFTFTAGLEINKNIK